MPDSEGYEIDFLPVGSGSKCGDAIAIRYGTPGNYKVLVYDGGTKESGQALVDHIKTHYGTSRVDFVVNSHPDSDHASGLSVVLEQLEVGELWMHRPWNYSEVIRDYFHDGRMTDASLAQRLKDKMSAAYALEALATEKKIPIHEPFAGKVIGPFVILSPDQTWYVHDLVPDFTKSPELKKDAAATSFSEAVLKALDSAKVAVASWVAEHWHFETLTEDGETSAENESSVVMFGQIDGKGILLTGDAGIRALGAAAKYAEDRNFSIPNNVHFIQVPHHGSRRNVSPSVLNRIVGAKLGFGEEATKIAYVSAAAGAESHPKKIVTNAFLRRGAKVFATKGARIVYRHQIPMRNGWVSINPIPFHEQVEQ